MNAFTEMIKVWFGTMRYPEIAEKIMNEITASELAYVLDILGIKNGFPYGDKYLNPLREVDPSMKLFDSLTERGFFTFIIGPNLDKLVMRIKHPKIYWGVMERKYKSSPIKLKAMNTIKMWIMSPHTDFETMLRWLKDVNPFILVDNTSVQHATKGTWINAFDNEIMVQPKRLVTDMSGSTLVDALLRKRENDTLDMAFHMIYPDISSVELYMFMPSKTLNKKDSVQIGHEEISMDWSERLFRHSFSMTHINNFMYINPLHEPLDVHRPNAEMHPRESGRDWRFANENPFRLVRLPAPKDMIRFSFTVMVETRQRIMRTMPPMSSDTPTMEQMFGETPMPLTDIRSWHDVGSGCVHRPIYKRMYIDVPLIMPQSWSRP